MPKLIDLTGQKFGRLTVLNISKKRSGKRVEWVCKCDCGKEVVISGTHLVSGHTKSCGCYKIDIVRERTGKHFLSRKERLYVTWMNMRSRCRNKNNKRYKSYGGRGIKVCEEWDNYLAFREWALSSGYTEELTIERIDVNGDYCPENCRWASWKEQARNKTTNHILRAFGRSMPAVQWAEETGISAETILARVNKLGWSVEKAVSFPVGGNHD